MAPLIHAVRRRPTFAVRGFTLTELAIVLFIVSLLLGGMLMPLSAQQEMRSRNETDKALAEARETVLGFTVINARLPCPDTDSDGLENVTSGACTNVEGDLPYATIGTTQSDAYGNRLRYRVTAAFATTSPAFSITTKGDITIASRGDDPTTTPAIESKFQNSLAKESAAVIISVGKNSYGGLRQEGGTRMAAPAAGTDELLNFAGTTKIRRLTNPAATNCSDLTEGEPFCEFDDQLVWISTTTLVNRMISAGRLL